ncbi:MAG: amidohydrolase family protein [Planctomycetes bacterium]|nr:amidohydrolase family protein [Planctomycetota bacterium]
MKKVFMIAIAVMLMASVAMAEEIEKPTQVLFTNVNIFDGKTDGLKKGMSVLVEGNLIKKIGKNINASDATVIDGNGRTLMPGLIDAHTHLQVTNGTDVVKTYTQQYNDSRTASIAKGYVMRGFTAVRDAGGSLMGLKRAIDEKMLEGPRIYSSETLISQTSGAADFRSDTDGLEYWGAGADVFTRFGLTRTVDGKAEMLKAVRNNLFKGAAQIKIYGTGSISSARGPMDSLGFIPEEIKAAVDASKDYDTYVMGHAHNLAGINRLLDAGVMSIEHASIMDESTAKKMKKLDAWAVPAMLACKMAQSGAPDYFNAQQAAKFLEYGKECTASYRLLAEFKVNVGFGSDMMGTPETHAMQVHELTARTKFYTPVEVLKQATSGNAKLLAMSNSRNPYQNGKLGVIAEGAYADILIVDRNPLKDISVLTEPDKNLKFIMKDGKVYKNTL